MNKLLHFIGIAYRAGKVQKGALPAEKAIKSGSARLVLLAGDCAENTKDKFSSLCQYYQVECFVTETKEALGLVSGGSRDRSVLAITEEGFAKRIIELIHLKESGML